MRARRALPGGRLDAHHGAAISARALTYCLGGILACAPLLGQDLEGTEVIDFDRPEAWAMRYFSSVAAMSSFGVAERGVAGRVRLGLEGGWVPSLSTAQRTVGFGGSKEEDLNKTPIFGRIRAEVGLPLGFAASAGYVPSLEMGGARPSLFSADLARPVWEGARTRVGLRAHFLAGTVRGDFTCDADTVAAGDDPVANPFACEEVSRDRVRMRTVGLETGVAVRLRDAAGPDLYATVSANRLEPRFQVNARYSGFADRTRLETSGNTVALTAGVRAALAERWEWAAEALYVPLTVRRPPDRRRENDDLLTARAVLSYRLR